MPAVKQLTYEELTRRIGAGWSRKSARQTEQLTSSRDGIQDICRVQVGKMYRGSMVKKIDIETTNLDSGKVKVRRIIHLQGHMTIIESSVHEHGDIFQEGSSELLPYDDVDFPSDSTEEQDDFTSYVRDETEKMRKKELLRQKARDIMKERRKGKKGGKENRKSSTTTRQ